MRSKIVVYGLVVFISLTLIPIAALGAPKFTLEHRYTWDSDMINSETAHSEGYTGKGVYIAVLDTGLTPNWRDYFPRDKIATKLGKGFYEPVHVDPQTGELVAAGFVVEKSWIGSTEVTHGTWVISAITGFNYDAPTDDADEMGSIYPLPPVFVEGIAPDATIIPVKVLETYHLPPYTGPGTPYPIGLTTGTDRAIAEGIKYATKLKLEGYGPMIISMSFGFSEPSEIIEDAIDYAIENGVIVVASAGNEGLDGMGWPAAYPQVISVGACGWRYEWLLPAPYDVPFYRLWWLQDNTYGYRDIPEPTPAEDIYVTSWSSREDDGKVAGYDQELDVVAPGSWVRGPYLDYLTAGYNHIPWWSNGNPPWNHYEGIPKGKNFYFVGGTSTAAPHVSAVASMMLEKNPNLTQSGVEFYLKSTALSLPYNSEMSVFDINDPEFNFAPGYYLKEWGGTEATGAGVVQADAAIDAVP